jgi:DNA-binding MurR/RpiR family transcriptional regulator
MSEQKWLRSSLRALSRQLAETDHSASPPTVARLLTKLGFSLKSNLKSKEAASDHPERDGQFRHNVPCETGIEAQKQAFQAAGLPIISVDTKKKELIGNFKNAGQAWCQEAEQVNGHDFLQDAVGRAVPYGIYDLSVGPLGPR